MIRKELEVNCSKNLELLMAYAFLQSPESLGEVASSVCLDKDRSALKISSLLGCMPREQGREIAERTLASSGFSNINMISQIKKLLKNNE